MRYFHISTAWTCTKLNLNTICEVGYSTHTKLCLCRGYAMWQHEQNSTWLANAKQTSLIVDTTNIWLTVHYVRENISIYFPNGLKQDASLPLLFNSAFKHAIKKMQVNQDGLQLSATHQLQLNTDDVNSLGTNLRVYMYRNKQKLD